MIIVKLDKRFRIHRDHGYTHGLKFREWYPDGLACERILRESLVQNKYIWWNTDQNPTENWVPHLTDAKKFWIFFKDESVLSMALLVLDDFLE